MKWISIFILVFTLQVFGQVGHYNRLVGTKTVKYVLSEDDTTVTSDTVWLKNVTNVKGSFTLNLRAVQRSGSYQDIIPYFRYYSSPESEDTLSYSQWYALTTIASLPADSNQVITYSLAKETWWTFFYGYEVKYSVPVHTGSWDEAIESWAGGR